MRNLLRGVLAFHVDCDRAHFAGLATGQSPDTLFVTCADSRVVPHVMLTSTPGALFVMRNVGNLVPRCDAGGVSEGDRSEAAAVEYAVVRLAVSDIVICGHSNCGAMAALVEGVAGPDTPNLAEWVRQASGALSSGGLPPGVGDGLDAHDRASQRNVVRQLENLRTYPAVRACEARGALRLHGWYFDIGAARVSAYDPAAGRFEVIDEAYVARVLRLLPPD